MSDKPSEPTFGASMDQDPKPIDEAALIKAVDEALSEPSEPKAELLLCPFCDAEAYLHTHYHDIAWHGKCRGCGVEGPDADNKAEAARLWNKRGRDKLGEAISRLNLECDDFKKRLDEAKARIAELEAANEWRPASEPPPIDPDPWEVGGDPEGYDSVYSRRVLVRDHEGRRSIGMFWHRNHGFGMWLMDGAVEEGVIEWMELPK